MDNDFSSKEAFLETIFHQYNNDIYRLCFTYVKRKEAAEDLTQEIFLKCYQNYDKFQSMSSIKTWIYRIAINHCKDFLKSGYSKYMIISEKILRFAKGKTKTPEDAVIEKDESAQITDQLLNLPIKYREVIVFYYFKELKIKEIASLLEVNENTVKSRLKRAKELLRISLPNEKEGTGHGEGIKRNGEDFLC